MIKSRPNFLLSILILFSFVILFRLAQFQIVDNDYWRAIARGQQRQFLQTQGERGKIFATDRNNNLHLVATNRSWEYVYISPGDIWRGGGDPEEISQRLGEILGIESASILQRINKRDSLYELLKVRLTPQEVREIREANFPGVYIRKDLLRYYPHDEFASHVIGFVGGEGSGQYGVENYYNSVLTGSKRYQEVDRSASGVISRIFSPSSDKGEDLILTIDYNIQFMAEKLLEEAQEKLNIEGGTIIVSDPHDGRILAMANLPKFNLNEYQKESDFRTFKNSAIQTIFEPGSIFKSITLAIALEEGKITPETTYQDQGFVQIGGFTIRNFGRRTWGNINMTKMLERSINTGAIFAQRLVGHDVFKYYLDKFELFKPTGIDLQGEVYSSNLSFKRGYEVNYANASFGQGIEFTSIQILKAFSALANGGRLVNPHVVYRGDSVEQGERVISNKTSSQITSMMISVTENGSAKSARIPGYYVAGKTGTAQVSWAALGQSRRGYSDKTIQNFVGYAPALDPVFIIIVKLHNPSTKTAEFSAAPIFRELGKYILNYYQIPPER
ncbi:MAG: penicillin-binding protein 2 [Candidatus Nealsonbacteria bacterium]|nr:penicillin-binding protein 2 [Candidatus Nealsonbacteria bacterium]